MEDVTDHKVSDISSLSLYNIGLQSPGLRPGQCSSFFTDGSQSIRQVKAPGEHTEHCGKRDLVVAKCPPASRLAAVLTAHSISVLFSVKGVSLQQGSEQHLTSHQLEVTRVTQVRLKPQFKQ